jgi:hypothetical protein
MYLKEDYYGNRPAAIEKVVAATLESQPLKGLLDSPIKIETAKEKLILLVDLIEVVQNYRSQIEELQTQSNQIDMKNASLNLRVRATLSGIKTLYLISKVLDEKSPLDKFQEVTDLAQAIIDEDYARIVFATNALFVNSGGIESNKFLPLMVELASAQSSTDMQKIFEAAAAPAGSYREKFKSDSLITITALAGVSRGREWYNFKGANSNYGWQPFLPVGLQFTKSFNDCVQNNYVHFGCGVIGGFVSVIDLGPLAAERNNGGTVSNSSNSGWAQAFSPGLYLTWNPPFAKPFVFGYGISKTPKLVTANTGEQVGATRRQFFIAIDMTLFAYR